MFNKKYTAFLTGLKALFGLGEFSMPNQNPSTQNLISSENKKVYGKKHNSQKVRANRRKAKRRVSL